MGASLTRTLGLGHLHSILLFQDLDAILQPRSSCLTSACTPTLPPSPFPLPHPQDSAGLSHHSGSQQPPLWVPPDGIRPNLALQKLLG